MSGVSYVCLPGTSFSGSTLLAFLLNSHPRIASIGEATGLVPRSRPAEYLCSCGRLLQECPFWRRVSAAMEAGGVPFRPDSKRWPTRFTVSRHRRLDTLLVRSLRSDGLDAVRDALLLSWGPLRRRLEQAGKASRELARAVLEATGKQVFVDSAQDPQRLKHLARLPGLEVKAVHLVRDVRGNAASLMRHEGFSAERAAALWQRVNLEADGMRRRLPLASWLQVRYSDLCNELARTLARIHRFLGMEPAPPPEDFRTAEHHILGNPMRLAGSGSVREDLSWQQFLSERQVGAIGRLAGAANRHFGYSWPSSSDGDPGSTRGARPTARTEEGA